MHEVLNSLQAFQTRALDIFDRVDAACGRADARLSDLDTRLRDAAGRIEAARGSTKPLVVRSARKLDASDISKAVQGSERPLGDIIGHTCAVSVLPLEITPSWSPPTVTAAAEDLARLMRSVPDGAPAKGTRSSHHEGKLLPPRGRIENIADLLLFNSGEMPYKGCAPDFDNLESIFEDEISVTRARTASTSRVVEKAAWLRLQEDDPDPLPEDLRFRPQPAEEVTIDLPDLPWEELGGNVADLMWRQDPASQETERPAWDAPAIPKSAVQPARQRAPAPAPATRRPAPVTTPRSNAGFPPQGAERPAVVTQAAPAATPPPASISQPPPKVTTEIAASGGAKGKGKAPTPPPPPPPKGKGKEKASKAPPPPPQKGKGKQQAPKAATAAPTPAAPPPEVQNKAKAEPAKAPPPPAPPKGKGKGKGGPAPPPAPPAQSSGGKGKTTPTPAKPKGAGSDMGQVFADIRSKGMAGLKKAPPPKIKPAPGLGRVVD